MEETHRCEREHSMCDVTLDGEETWKGVQALFKRGSHASRRHCGHRG